MSFENLPDELKEKARACKTPEDMLALAKEQGIELDDAQLEAVSGGNAWDGKCEEFVAPCQIICAETSKNPGRRTKLM